MTRFQAIAIAAAMIAGCSTTPVAPSAKPSATADAKATGSPAPPATAPPSSAPPSTQALVGADLDGVLTTPDLAHRLPISVSIDDSRVARPQSGFNGASIVWHAPADGYEMRYLLIFQEDDATEVGPVRSTRNYSVHWTAELRGGLAHYGGDKASRDLINAHSGKLFTDLEGLGRANSAFHRISTREAPHNAYTSTAELWRIAGKLGAAPTITSTVHVRPFRDDQPAGDRGASQRIAIPYRTVEVGYEYDPASNAYLRLVDGRPHIDPMDDKVVTAQTVVVLYMRFRTDTTIEKGHSRPVLGYIGTGEAQVLSEGRLVQGTWSKENGAAPTLILGLDGEELPLPRGRIFIQVVPLGTIVDIHP